MTPKRINCSVSSTDTHTRHIHTEGEGGERQRETERMPQTQRNHRHSRSFINNASKQTLKQKYSKCIAKNVWQSIAKQVCSHRLYFSSLLGPWYQNYT